MRVSRWMWAGIVYAGSFTGGLAGVLLMDGGRADGQGEAKRIIEADVVRTEVLEIRTASGALRGKWEGGPEQVAESATTFFDREGRARASIGTGGLGPCLHLMDAKGNDTCAIENFGNMIGVKLATHGSKEPWFELTGQTTSSRHLDLIMRDEGGKEIFRAPSGR